MSNLFIFKPILINVLLSLVFAHGTAMAESGGGDPKSLVPNSATSSTVAQTNAEVAKQAAPQTGATGEFVFKYLVGEVAGQRGEMGLSSKLFYELAQSSQDPRLAERAAKSAIYSGNLQLAIPATQLWVKLNPTSDEAQQASTQIALSTGNLAQAKSHLQKLLEKEEGRANGFLYLNTLLAHEKDKKAVLNLLQELAQPYPKLPEAHFTIAHAAWEAEQSDLAIAETDKADELHPGWEINAVLKGQLLFSKNSDQAIDFYRAHLKKYPESNQVRLTLARMLVNQKRLTEAKPELERLIKGASGTPEILVVVGLLSAQAEDYQAATRSFEAALETDFKDKDQLYLYLGQVAEKQKNDAKALAWYQKVGQGDHYVEANIDIATIISSNENVDIAIKKLDDLQDLNDAQIMQVVQAQANLLGQAKRYQDAYELLAKASANLPTNAALSYDYAMAAERVNQSDVSEKELRKLIQLKPDFAQAYNALGYSLADRNVKLDEAKQLIQKALALSPNDHYILDSMGWVEYRLGELDQAATHLREAYATQADPEIAAHLGEVLWQQGKKDEALKTWGDALQAHPDSQPLLDATKKFTPK
jgi:tetratricopeptide (TPR) repeat protein